MELSKSSEIMGIAFWADGTDQTNKTNENNESKHLIQVRTHTKNQQWFKLLWVEARRCQPGVWRDKKGPGHEDILCHLRELRVYPDEKREPLKSVSEGRVIIRFIFYVCSLAAMKGIELRQD